MESELSSKALKPVPREKAFYFFTSIGNYTGISAVSLKEFMERTRDVDVKSLEFHLARGDFEKWMDEVLQDKELAGDIRRMQKSNVSGEVLRNQLTQIVSRRIRRLANPSSFY